MRSIYCGLKAVNPYCKVFRGPVESSGKWPLKPVREETFFIFSVKNNVVIEKTLRFYLDTK